LKNKIKKGGGNVEENIEEWIKELKETQNWLIKEARYLYENLEKLEKNTDSVRKKAKEMEKDIKNDIIYDEDLGPREVKAHLGIFRAGIENYIVLLCRANDIAKDILDELEKMEKGVKIKPLPEGKIQKV